MRRRWRCWTSSAWARSFANCRKAEPLHRSFPLPGGLMRVLDPIVEVLRAAMLDRCQQLAVGDLVAAEYVGDDHPRHVLQVFEQRAEESFGGHRISAGLTRMSSTLPCWST